MNTISAISISNLCLEARQYPTGSRKRERLVNQMIRQMQRSGKIWRDYRLDTDQYQEALQRTWAWFCQNLHSYDPTQSSLTTWFNCILKYRIKDVLRESQAHRRQQICLPDDETFDLISNLPAPSAEEPLQWLSDLLIWLHQEQSQLEQITIRDRPDISAYYLILRRLPTQNQASWKELSTQLDVAIPTLSSFYRRQCLPLLREFGKLQGWIDSSAPQSNNKTKASITSLKAGTAAQSMRSHSTFTSLPKTA
jgi:DNA-directed RNA polymerase specialized sigma24 family protein